MRTCKTCKQEKDDHNFYTTTSKSTGRECFDTLCIKCRNVKHKERRSDTQLEYQYSITKAQWELILKMQDNKCKICRKEFDGKIDVDHDHKTMVVRGLLCPECNRALGLLNDDPERMEDAADYVRRANALKELYEL